MLFSLILPYLKEQFIYSQLKPWKTCCSKTRYGMLSCSSPWGMEIREEPTYDRCDIAYWKILRQTTDKHYLNLYRREGVILKFN